MKTKVYIGLIAAALLPSLVTEAQNNDSRDYNNDYPGTVINNYYDYDYASRINRFHRSYAVFDYYSPVFTDSYWYGYEPVSFGVSLYGGFGFGFGIGFGLGFSYNYPGYYGWDYPYFSGSYYWGYNPYYYGYYPHSWNHYGYGHNWHNDYYAWNGHNHPYDSRRGYNNHYDSPYHNENRNGEHYSNPGHNGKYDPEKNNSQGNNVSRRVSPNFTRSDFSNGGNNKMVNITSSRRENSTITQSGNTRAVNNVTVKNISRSPREESSAAINRSANNNEVNFRRNNTGIYQNRSVSNYSIAPNARRSTDVIGQTHNNSSNRSLSVAPTRPASRPETFSARPVNRSTVSQNPARTARIVSSSVKSSSSSAGHGASSTRRTPSGRNRS